MKLRLLRGEGGKDKSVKVNKGLVDFLEEYLAKAKAGEVVHGAFAFIHKDGHPGHFVAHPSVSLLGSTSDFYGFSGVEEPHGSLRGDCSGHAVLDDEGTRQGGQ